MESPAILKFVVEIQISSVQTLEKFLLKKGLKKAQTITRFPPRPPAHEVDFCSEVLDLSSVLNLHI